MTDLKRQMKDVLTTNILPYWMEKVVDPVHGGFLGRVDGRDMPHPDAEKGAVMNARILWAFSAAYRVLGDKAYLAMATRARDYVLTHFVDPVYGGVYWSLKADGSPLDTKKQTYAIGFTIYGLSEYARATGDRDTLAAAISLYHDLERHAFDKEHNGYVEALTRDWQPIADMRLSDKDENGSRTMNTHLHVIEPYTNLYRVWKNEELKERLVNLLHIFTDRLLNPETRHLDLFFDDTWQGRRNIESYGHDIEASWLLHETALVLEDDGILAEMEPVVRAVATAADEGLRPDGSMVYEYWKDRQLLDSQRQWWVQCENIIGHVNLYQHFHHQEDMEKAWRCWQYVDRHLVDRRHGEWYWAVLEDGTVNMEDDKAGFWKCPYHNARMCLELLEREY